MQAAANVLPFAMLEGTQEGTLVLFRGGYSYHQNSVKTNGIVTTVYLRCTSYATESCTGTGIIRQVGGESVWDGGQRHTCVRDELNYQERLLKAEILQACREDLYESPARLLNRIANRYNPEVPARVRTANYRFSMRRARMNLYTGIPPDLTAFGAILEDPNFRHLSATADGSDNMYCHTVGLLGSRSVIFLSHRMLSFLEEMNMVFADATFVSTPAIPGAQQLWQIVAVVQNKVIPIVQAVMESKSVDAYVAILQHLRVIAPGFRPQKVMLDCEKSQINAFSQVFGCKILCCYVHFIRANLRKCATLGLGQLLNNDLLSKKIRDAFLCIPLLPEELFHTGVSVLLRYARKVNRSDALEPYFRYFLKTWMGLYFFLLSVYGEKHRTNNPCESAHHCLRRETGPHHPGVWKFLNALKNYEQRSYVDAEAYRLGLPLTNGRRLSATLNDAAINRHTQDLMEGTISVRRFLFRASARIRNLIDE